MLPNHFSLIPDQHLVLSSLTSVPLLPLGHHVLSVDQFEVVSLFPVVLFTLGELWCGSGELGVRGVFWRLGVRGVFWRLGVRGVFGNLGVRGVFGRLGGGGRHNGRSSGGIHLHRHQER